MVKTKNNIRYKRNRPQSTSHVPPSAQSHSDLGTPIVLAGCLEGIRDRNAVLERWLQAHRTRAMMDRASHSHPYKSALLKGSLHDPSWTRRDERGLTEQRLGSHDRELIREKISHAALNLNVSSEKLASPSSILDRSPFPLLTRPHSRAMPCHFSREVIQTGSHCHQPHPLSARSAQFWTLHTLPTGSAVYLRLEKSPRKLLSSSILVKYTPTNDQHPTTTFHSTASQAVKTSGWTQPPWVTRPGL